VFWRVHADDDHANLLEPAAIGIQTLIDRVEPRRTAAVARELERRCRDSPDVLMAGDGPEATTVGLLVPVHRVLGPQPVEPLMGGRLLPDRRVGEVDVAEIAHAATSAVAKSDSTSLPNFFSIRLTMNDMTVSPNLALMPVFSPPDFIAIVQSTWDFPLPRSVTW